MADKNLEVRIVAVLERLIVEELDVNLAQTELDPDASFFECGLGLDSIAIVELISLAEERFALQFADEDLVESSFSSLRTFAKLIASKPGLELAS